VAGRPDRLRLSEILDPRRVTDLRERGPWSANLSEVGGVWKGGLERDFAMKRYAYAWLTGLFFLVSIIGHWIFGWFAFVDEQQALHQAPSLTPYLVEMGRDTFENWQSEFLQLIWQVVGLAYFLYVGSPSSKENDDRSEAKLDVLIRLQAGEKAEDIIADIDRRYLRAGGHSKPHGHTDANLASGRE
jgi:hypothetical protein